VSGIVALFRLDGAPVAQAVLDAMLDAQSHRGPDARGSHVDGSIGLGHGLLATTLEDTLVQQPLRDRRAERWLVADARLDNRDELFADGLAASRAPAQVSDAELLLEAYDRWGDACATHLVGDFAFALWDAPRRRLFCARDHLGVRQLYYHRDARTFRCASEMQPLFADPSVRKRPHRVSVGLYLIDEYSEREQTLYDGVLALPAGHTMVVTPERFRVGAYWRPDPWKETRLATSDAYAERFREVFAEAVRCRLRSSRPLASHVTGGVDSSSIASMAEKLRRERPDATPSLELLTLAFAGLACDEQAFSRTVADRWDLRFTAVSALDAQITNPEWSARYPDTYYRPTLMMLGLLLDVARARGIRTTLAGFGSDQLMHRAERAQLADYVRRGQLSRALRPFHPEDPTPSLRTLLTIAASVFVPERVRAPLRRVRGSRRAMPRWLSADLARDVSAALEEQASALARVSYPSLVSRHFCEWLTHNRDVPMGLALYDRLAARSQGEFRYPFFDVRLVDLVLGFPQTERAGEGAQPSKPLLRRAMRGILPDAIHDRHEGAEFTPYVEWAFSEHRAVVAAMVDRSRLAAEGFVNQEHMRTLTALHEIVVVLGMERWLREGDGLNSFPNAERRTHERGR
jgi:asparagine synthase (glutamine-hydrolysing)